MIIKSSGVYETRFMNDGVIMAKYSKIAIAVFSILIFFIFFNGYKAAGPARSKFKKLGEGVEDLTKEEVAAPEADRLSQIVKNKHFKPWVEWWQKCAQGFALENMDDIGQTAVYDQGIAFKTPSELNEGPGGVLIFRSPGGRYYLDPYFGRLLYRKEDKIWQPYVELRCGAAIYTPSEKKAKNVLECSALEGIDDAFWLDKSKFVLMGYSALTRQMNVECEGLQTCASPTVWLVDLKSGYINEYRGKVIKRKTCELGGYLKVRWPDFFCTKDCKDR